MLDCNSMSENQLTIYILFSLSFLAIYFSMLVFYANKFSKNSGEGVWFFLYYGSVPWQMDPKYKYCFPQIVLIKDQFSQVSFIQGLHFKFGFGGVLAALLLLVLFRYF